MDLFNSYEHAKRAAVAVLFARVLILTNQLLFILDRGVQPQCANTHAATRPLQLRTIMHEQTEAPRTHEAPEQKSHTPAAAGVWQNNESIFVNRYKYAKRAALAALFA